MEQMYIKPKERDVWQVHISGLPFLKMDCTMLLLILRFLEKCLDTNACLQPPSPVLKDVMQR